MVHLFEGSDLRLHIGSLKPDVGSFVAHLIAVVGCAENSQHFASLLVLEAFWLDFVTADEHC